MARWLLGLLMVVVVSLCLVVDVSDAQPKKKMGRPGKAGKTPKRRMGAIVKDLEKNVSALWDEVEMLSQPVHVHLHGDGHVMDRHGHDHNDHGHHDHDHHDHGHHDHDHHDHDHDDHDHHDHHDHNETETHGHDDDKHRHHKHDDDDDDHKHHHKHHKHGHKKHKYHHKHDDKMMKKKKKGHADDAMQASDPSHMHEEEDEDEDMHHGHHGTHVHIHLHTGMEEDEKQEKLFDPLPQEYRYARCDMVGDTARPVGQRQNIRGTVFLRQMPDQDIEMAINLQGFVIDHRAERDHRHLRGLHGHEYGDMSDGCKHQGGHYNPRGVNHGGPGEEVRLLLAAMHYNENADRDDLVDDEGTQKIAVMFPKAKKGEYSIRKLKLEDATYDYVSDLMLELFDKYEEDPAALRDSLPDSFLDKPDALVAAYDHPSAEEARALHFKILWYYRIHEGEDDLGKGGNAGSLRSGNAGHHLACCSVVACAEPQDIFTD